MMKVSMSLKVENFGVREGDHVSFVEINVPEEFCFSADLVEVSERVLIPSFTALRNHYMNVDQIAENVLGGQRITLPTALRQAKVLARLGPPR
jgi:hypothetical protein